MICFIAGYYLGNMIEKKDLMGKKAKKLFLVGVLTIMISCFAMKYMVDMSEPYGSLFYNNLNFISAAVVFCLTRYLFEKNSGRISVKVAKLIIILGGTSFGIMLMEDILRVKTQFVFEFLNLYCGSFLACILWVLTAWGVWSDWNNDNEKNTIY